MDRFVKQHEPASASRCAFGCLCKASLSFTSKSRMAAKHFGPDFGQFTYDACVLVSYGNAIAEGDVLVHRALLGHSHGIGPVSLG